MGKTINVDSEIMFFQFQGKLFFLVEILAIIDKYFKESQSSINLINNQSIEFHLIFVPTIDMSINNRKKYISLFY